MVVAAAIAVQISAPDVTIPIDPAVIAGPNNLPQAVAPTTPAPVDWGTEVDTGPYKITLGEPAAPSVKDGEAIFGLTVTIVADEPIAPSTIPGMITGKDANHGHVGVASLGRASFGTGVLPAGARRTVKTAQIYMTDGEHRNEGFTLTLHDDEGRGLATWTMPAVNATGGTR
jgi:hypothetical protein